MNKIVITGGLGYIGTELCKLYSGEARYKNIIVVDNRFKSERVKQLRDWGIKFVHGSILDKNLISGILYDADTVFHLAGITDVAYTKSGEDPQQEKIIEETGVNGTRLVLACIPKTCKILFPSTHVVYEGLKKTKKDITEDESTHPVLTYARGKIQSENDLKSSSKNFIILRLASVYGYSTDTMRLSIMPNLFSKIASQNGTIQLFSGGIQLKSLVPLIDVARCFKFMAEKENICREIFHVSKESVTVKEVAELCKNINPQLTIKETKDEIPNLGYTISNKKLLSTGFTFRHNLERSLNEMIVNWSEKSVDPELEYIIQGDNDFIDERGSISNYELPEPINWVGLIESKKGVIRANHYHPVQEQKCLLVTGKYISVIKDLSTPGSPINTRIVNAGDISIIKPNVAHTMVFLEDSIFLNLVRGEREHKNYGITHTIPHVLVDKDLSEQLIQNYSTKCRISGSKNLKPVLSLGLSPLANNLLNSEKDKDELHPLEMTYCPDSHNCQLSYIVPPQKMFDHYLYVSSTTNSFMDHFKHTAKQYIKEFQLTSKSLVVDIGSNDGIFLRPLKDKNIQVIGIEPAQNIAKMALDQKIEVINKYFTDSVAEEICNKFGHADLVTASNVFAHADNIDEITHGAFKLLKKGGSFVIEVQYLLDMINNLTFDNIYHEHINYWSVTSLNNFFTAAGYAIYKVEHIDTHGGSIRVYICETPSDIDESVPKFLEEEDNFGLKDYKTYIEFSKQVRRARDSVRKNIDLLVDQKLVIAGYGSPAKATTTLNYYGVTKKDIHYIIDDNQLKQNKFIPGARIPICSRDMLEKNSPDVVIVMAWNFYDEITKNNQELIQRGIKFIKIKDLENPDFSLP